MSARSVTRPAHTGAPRSRRIWAGLIGGLMMLALVVLPVTPAAAVQPVDEVHYSFTSKTSVAIDWRGDANDVRWGADHELRQHRPGRARRSGRRGPRPARSGSSSSTGSRRDDVPLLDRRRPRPTFHTPPTGSFRFDAIGDVGDTASFSTWATR